MTIDIQSEDDIERLRQVAMLQEAENAFLHERIAALSEELDKIRKQKQGQLQQELMGIKQHLADAVWGVVGEAKARRGTR